LRERLDAAAFRGRVPGEDPVLTTERQFRAVMAARDRVEAALACLRGKPAIEILAFEVREAAGHLRELLGEIAPDEVLGRIFAGFCIGK
jgi:tRNA modification GTPase